MPTYADNYTFRVRGSYIAAGVPHKMKVRGTPDASGTAAGEVYASQLNDYISSFEAHLWTDWAWLGWEYADPDSDIWVPFSPVLAGGAIVGAINPATAAAVKKAMGICHSGRVAGSRGRLYWFGLSVLDAIAADGGANGVLLPAEEGGLSGATGLANDLFCGGNGELAIWYNRLTVKVNDDVLKLVRRGIVV